MCMRVRFSENNSTPLYFAFLVFRHSSNLKILLCCFLEVWTVCVIFRYTCPSLGDVMTSKMWSFGASSMCVYLYYAAAAACLNDRRLLIFLSSLRCRSWPIACGWTATFRPTALARLHHLMYTVCGSSSNSTGRMTSYSGQVCTCISASADK